MAILNDEIIFLIVTYKEKYYECDSFTSLLKSFKRSGVPALNVMVFDNTVDDGWEIAPQSIPHVNVYYYTEKSNRGISHAYNFLALKASDKGFKWMVLLDQDTSLPEDFISQYLTVCSRNKIYCPKVFVGDNLMSPSLYKNYRSYPLRQIEPHISEIDLAGISCINSGLMINIDYFLSVGGYNENIQLDFCDHDFLLKIKKLGLECIGIIDCKLYQNFSFETHNKEQAITRYKMFVRDIKGFYKGKSAIKVFFNVDLPRLLKLTYQHKSLRFLSIRF